MTAYWSTGKGKWCIVICSLLFTLLIISEIILRRKYGFCDAVLMKEDPHFEYIAQPNQNRYRLGNRFQVNSLSMRSEEIDSSAIIILGFGDSVFNGGTLTDQDSLASTILSKSLSAIKRRNVQFLNISAGSWGPDNCFAYLEQHGNFNAVAMYLFVSSHDAYDNMTFHKIVDIHKSFPSKQYSFAILELLERYIFSIIRQYFCKKASEFDNLNIINDTFNSGFGAFYRYSISHKIPLTIFLHAEKEELEKGFYNEQGREIIAFAKKHSIPLIMDLKDGLKTTDFRDNIHINAQGQKRMADLILKNMPE